mmetsp:Transcript_8183/g.11367  ORF Transcript_8183/g.11367 Transcript_8183/m.11367 type:complete len:267 (+) Transcript_8183:313-1113(+)
MLSKNWSSIERCTMSCMPAAKTSSSRGVQRPSLLWSAISSPALRPSRMMKAPRTLIMFRWSSWPSSTTMPASRKHIFACPRPSASSTTRILPGCRSPCIKLCTKDISYTALAPMSQIRFFVSSSALRYLRMGVPRTNVSTSRSSRLRAGNGRGNSTIALSLKSSFSRSRLVSSWRRSICAMSILWNSPSVSRTERYCRRGKASRQEARKYMRSTSPSTLSRMLGCSTFTATSSPVAASRPRYTWAMQPEPIGRRSSISSREHQPAP